MLGLLLGGCGGTAAPIETLATPGALQEPTAKSTPSATPDRTDAAWSPGQADAPPPERVMVPRLKISAGLDPLALDTAGILIPPQYGRAGWYEDGPEPGEPGRAVVAGHVDSKKGPDVFARLGEARTGDRILVLLQDGTEVAYRVDDVGLFPQSRFPTDRVYGGSADRSEIRLITCGGPYDHRRGRYSANVVVFARLVI